MLLSFQPGGAAAFNTLTIDELRQEYAVQQIMLQLLLKQADIVAEQTPAPEKNSQQVLQRQPTAEPSNNKNTPAANAAKPTLCNNVVEYINDGYIELDKNLCYIYTNRKIEEITGLGQDFWVGKHIWDVFKEEVGSPTYHAIEKALKEKEYTFSEDYYPQLGVLHESHIYPTEGGLAIFIVDATARKKTEQQLKETCEIGKIGGWEAILGEKKIFISEISAQILGVNGTDVLTLEDGLAFFNLEGDNPENKEIHQSIRASVKKGEGFDEEVKLKLGDGREKWVRIKGQVESSTQNGLRLTGILQDITKIKAAQEKSFENEKRFRLFMNNSPLAAWICDSKGVFEYVNKQYYTMFRPQDVVVGKSLNGFYPPNVAAEYTAENNALITKKQTLTNLRHTLTQNGYEQHFLVNKFLFDDNDENPKLGGIAVDITEQEKTNRQLAEQQRFLHGITYNAPGLMSYWDKDLVCTFTNQTAKVWLGTELKDIVGHGMEEVLGKTLFANNYPYIKRALLGETVQFERGGFNIKGVPGFIWIQYVPDIENDVVKGFYSLVTDITELKKTQLAIEFEEKDKEALINSSNDFICSLDRDLRVITANKAYKDFIENVTGLPVKKGDHVKTGQGFNDETWAIWNSFFERALAGESFTEETVTRPEGANWDLWTECAFTPIIQNGEITGLACYSRNITERKLAQNTIKHNEEKLRGLLQNISDIITLVDESGVITYVSASVTEILGYQEDEVLGKNIFELIHPDNLAEAFAELQRSLPHPGYNTTLELKVLHKNGHYVYIEARGTNQLYNPLIKALLINCRDITERKEAEKAIAATYKNLEDYRFALDQAGMVFIANAEGEVTYVNENFCNTSKYLAEELVGKKLGLLNSGHHTEDFYDNIWKTVRAGKVWKGQMKNKAKDGSFYWINATVTPFVDDEGAPYQFLGIDTDITDTKLAEEALLLSNERFNYVLDATFDAIWDLDLQKKTIFWGDGYKKLFGYEPGFSAYDAKQDFYDKVHPDDLDGFLNSSQSAIDGNSPYWAVSYRFLKANQEYAFIADKAIIIRDDKGQPIRMIGAMQDITTQKTAALAIAESYKKLEEYKFALDESAMVFIIDDKGIFTYVNDNFCRLTKYTRQELIGSHRAILASGYHPQSFYNHLMQTVTSGKVWRAQVKGKAKDGSFYWVEATITPISNELGKPFQFLSINSEITQTKLAEEALRISNERFEYVTRATFDAIWDWDIVNNTLIWGDGYQTLFGYAPKTEKIEPGKEFSSQIHPNERPAVLKSIEECLKSDALYWTQSYRFCKANGEYAYVTDKAIVVRDEHGIATRMIGAMQDITDRVKAQQQIEESEIKFRSMVHNINDVIALVDENGFVTYSSPSLKTILGYEPEEVLGKKVFTLVHPDDYNKGKEVFKTLLAYEGSGGVIEFRYRHKNGHYLIMESQGNNQLHNPVIKAAILTTRDITSRKEKEEEKMVLVHEVMEKNADLKQFSYITSHNLRAPLTNLMAICTLFDEGSVTQEDTDLLIKAFKTSTAKLSDTLNDLINILIIKDGKSQEIQNVLFEKTLTSVKASISGTIQATGAVIHADFSAAPSVPFYPAYMESILINLLTNAIKYAHPGRKPVIAIQTRDEEKFVVLTFMDNGIGMNMSRVKTKIFGLYQRFQNKIEGKGIGLYLVHSQITALGGTITVDSKEGEGTTFVIWFKKELFKRK